MKSHQLLALSFLIPMHCSAGVFVITDSFSATNDKDYASGTFTDNGGSGTWSVTTDVTTTGADTAPYGWYNDSGTNKDPQAGSLGIQTTFRNDSTNESAANEAPLTVNFSASADDGYQIGNITISQSPYNNLSGDNGVSYLEQMATFTLSWSGGGTALVNDPAGQLSSTMLNSFYAQGEEIAAGNDPGFTATNGLSFSSTQTFYYTTDLNNDSDQWSITLPDGVGDVTVEWDSYLDNARNNNFGLKSEWISFNATIVPEPSSAVLVALSGISLLARRKRS
ncbi:PEP-CTERM sorting domain-containing protein [Persicirhabdus sediminis]|uniref:PEP-CTERM sorting domain-containing protein n=1 Tax=Persicirhabdus sediminis TaxID=454144 RepID=A0A8J7MD92_9BACT|nr:PEP-CTERM sorting domain-containing protein [Persicirhabdus sediminis]MBK1790430.1 PEP-CTERM sorting domain-containing protein [Persicirhabdus sediminis]